jgi:hypothetical protein
VARERVFEFGRDGLQTTSNPITSFGGPWGIATDGGLPLDADFGRVSAAPRLGTREIWTLRNGGGGWDHPIHIHFEEGQILARKGKGRTGVPAWERGRKDVYRLRPSGEVTITMQFRDWGGMFMEHCHNTVHEDNAMLLRWDISEGGQAVLRPLPTPIPTPQGVTFIAPGDILPGAYDSITPAGGGSGGTTVPGGIGTPSSGTGIGTPSSGTGTATSTSGGGGRGGRGGGGGGLDLGGGSGRGGGGRGRGQ